MHLYGGAVGNTHVCDVCGGAEFVLLSIAIDKFVDDFVFADMVVVKFGAYSTVVGLEM